MDPMDHDAYGGHNDDYEKPRVMAGDVIQFPVGANQRRIQQETAPTKPDAYTPAGSSVVPIRRG